MLLPASYMAQTCKRPTHVTVTYHMYPQILTHTHTRTHVRTHTHDVIDVDSVFTFTVQHFTMVRYEDDTRSEKCLRSILVISNSVFCVSSMAVLYSVAIAICLW